MSLPRNVVLVGDVRERLAELPDGSVDCVMTSPPYFQLRNYGRPGADRLGGQRRGLGGGAASGDARRRPRAETGRVGVAERRR